MREGSLGKHISKRDDGSRCDSLSAKPREGSSFPTTLKGPPMPTGKRGPKACSEQAKHRDQAMQECYGPDLFRSIGYKGGQITKEKDGADYSNALASWEGRNRVAPEIPGWQAIKRRPHTVIRCGRASAWHRASAARPGSVGGPSLAAHLFIPSPSALVSVRAGCP